MTWRKPILVATALMLWLLPVASYGQVIISAVHLPADACAGSQQTVSIGYLPQNEVVVGRLEASLGHSDQIFLPDGVMCNGSCSYRSPVTFTVFNDNDSISSVEDIKFLRLKIEHSFIGDIYINVTCPNGQKADLMRFAGTGSSSCDGTIPENSRNWLPGNNVGQDAYFGHANDDENTEMPCDPTAPGNQPGIGWNYCWSNNTTSGYQYASGDGIIYRSGHEHGRRIDSSHVAARTNFYHPDESFNHLVGCPLNGTWYIEVVDGYSVDNGYIFEWELALDASLIPDQCEAESYAVEGGTSVQLNDSTFKLVAPATLERDTAVTYRFLVVTTCGDTVDTTATIRYHPNRESDTNGVICEGDIFHVGNQSLTTAGAQDVHLNTMAGCDSTVHVTLTVNPTYDFHFDASTCLNVPYTFEGSTYTMSGVYPHRMTTVDGCDSVRTLHLNITSENLQARIKAVPLIVDPTQTDIKLEDVSRNHVASRWMIDGAVYEDRKLTIAYPVEFDSLLISLEAVSNEGCYDTATVTARYDRATLFVPNAFTPNREENNLWKPVGYELLEIEVWIYDRQGVLVAHLEGPDEAWNGAGSSPGAYVYTIHYRTQVRPGWKQVKTGTILLIK